MLLNLPHLPHKRKKFEEFHASREQSSWNILSVPSFGHSIQKILQYLNAHDKPDC